jgi:hypothetical protein
LMDMGASIEISGNFMEGIITLAYILVISLGTVGTIYFGYKTNRNLRTGP